jgi:hypothetical protein
MNEQKKHNSEKPSDATEAGYLADQVSEASAAIGQAFAALKADLAKGVDPTTLARQYPWATVGAAAVAGFLAASAVVPSKEEQALKKLERIERALRPYPFTPDQPVNPAAAGAAANQNKSITGRIFSEVFSALKPALSSALAAYAAAPAPEDKNENGNGHTASAVAAGNAVYYQQEADPDSQQQPPAT